MKQSKQSPSGKVIGNGFNDQGSDREQHRAVASRKVVHGEPKAEHPSTISPDAIRERAYHLWIEAGSPTSNGVEYWLEAERELNGGK